MNSGRTVFAQLLGFVPFAHFEHLVDKYQANRWTRDFTAWSHFICMAYAQFTRREGLRDLIACLSSQSSKLYHVGLRNRVTRSTLADANERRNCELFESLGQRQCSFVVRGKDNLSYKTIDSHVFDCSTGVRCDQTIQLLTKKSEKAYPEPLRRVAFFDEKTQLDLVFLSNRMDLPALTIAAIYKQRWQIELFFKWLKQNLTIKHFFGNSLNAVKSQIWIAVCVYLIALMAHFTRVESSPARSFSLMSHADSKCVDGKFEKQACRISK